MTNYNHKTVLEKEAVDFIQPSFGKRYIDATLGGGGHARKILDQGGIVLGIDQDADAIEHTKSLLAKELEAKKLVLVKGNFRNISQIAGSAGFGQVDGILLDIGVSSYQLDHLGRGFSFRHDEKLDMRMDQGQEFSAYTVVNTYSRERLIEIFIKYGEEHNARKIADEIVKTRKSKEIETTKELASLIERVPHASEAIHPATRVFQALRIEVNDEIEALKECLEQSTELLVDGGRIVVISFHSLEDRVVKQAFKMLEKNGYGASVVKKPIVSGSQESQMNRRSRSAKMRVFEKKSL